jgi:hypothetical protein
MNAAEVLSALTAHDATVVVEGERIRVLHPVGNPPPSELIDAARQHKEALRSILEGGPNSIARGINPRRFGRILQELERCCPACIDFADWKWSVADGRVFLALWGEQAEALGWTGRDLFGLAAVPERPVANYRRLSRYDLTGLVWFLKGRPVVALTDATAAIQSPSGAILTYRRNRKPALGPLGDSLDDWGTS